VAVAMLREYCEDDGEEMVEGPRPGQLGGRTERKWRREEGYDITLLAVIDMLDEFKGQSVVPCVSTAVSRRPPLPHPRPEIAEAHKSDNKSRSLAITVLRATASANRGVKFGSGLFKSYEMTTHHDLQASNICYRCNSYSFPYMLAVRVEYVHVWSICIWTLR
jgi:hypothetical protein